MTRFWETLQVWLEIIVATNSYTIYKTHVFSLCSYVWIYVPMYIYNYPSTHGVSGQAVGSAAE